MGRHEQSSPDQIRPMSMRYLKTCAFGVVVSIISLAIESIEFLHFLLKCIELSSKITSHFDLILVYLLFYCLQYFTIQFC